MTAAMYREVALALDAAPDFGARWKAMTPVHRLLSPGDLVEGCRALEAVAFHATDLSFFLSVVAGAGLGLPILDRANHPLAAAVRKGEAVTATAITERGAGSDVRSMTCALSDDGEMRLSGTKWNITNAPVADHFIVFVQNQRHATPYLTCVLVPRAALGVSVTPQDIPGCEGSPTGTILFDDVRVEPEWVLGAERDGQSLLALAFGIERLLAPWPLLGKMEWAVQKMVDHAANRVQFGQPIERYQYVQGKIVEAYIACREARTASEHALTTLDASGADGLHVSCAKMLAADAAVLVFRRAIEVLGARGMQREARLVEYLNGALAVTIAGGTRETHKKAIFEGLRADHHRASRGRPMRYFSNTLDRDR